MNTELPKIESTLTVKLNLLRNFRERTGLTNALIAAELEARSGKPAPTNQRISNWINETGEESRWIPEWVNRAVMSWYIDQLREKMGDKTSIEDQSRMLEEMGFFVYAQMLRESQDEVDSRLARIYESLKKELDIRYGITLPVSL